MLVPSAGTVEYPGRILIMTSNYPERLDKALVRKGRVDLNLRMKKASAAITKEMYENFYDDTWPEHLSLAAANDFQHPTNVTATVPQLRALLGVSPFFTVICHHCMPPHCLQHYWHLQPEMSTAAHPCPVLLRHAAPDAAHPCPVAGSEPVPCLLSCHSSSLPLLPHWLYRKMLLSTPAS